MSDVSIFSDGSSRGTIVSTAEGEVIKNVASATVWIDATEETRVDIQLRPAHIEVTGGISTVNYICPACGDEFEHTCGQASDGSGGTTTGQQIGNQAPLLGISQCSDSVSTLYGTVWCDRPIGHNLPHFGVVTSGGSIVIPWMWGGAFGFVGKQAT